MSRESRDGPSRTIEEQELCTCSSCQRLAHEPMSLRIPRSIYHKRLDEITARRRGMETGTEASPGPERDAD